MPATPTPRTTGSCDTLDTVFCPGTGRLARGAGRSRGTRSREGRHDVHRVARRHDLARGRARPYPGRRGRRPDRRGGQGTRPAPPAGQRLDHGGLSAPAAGGAHAGGDRADRRPVVLPGVRRVPGIDQPGARHRARRPRGGGARPGAPRPAPVLRAQHRDLDPPGARAGRRAARRRGHRAALHRSIRRRSRRSRT